MKSLKNHNGMLLRNDAADSWNRFEKDHGVHAVNSAYRSQAEQNVLLNRYANPKSKYDRPPYLYAPARISRHTSGIAVDTPNAEALSRTTRDYGWLFLFSYDAVHLEYNPAYDKHKSILAFRGPKYSEGVVNQQDFLNRARGERLVKDGLAGKLFKAAVTRYQKFLRKYGYTGPLDGVWGNGTQKAHAKYFAEWKRTH